MELYFPILLDGATGTELQKRGYKGEICPELWTLQHPEAMQDLQKKYVDAGSQIVYAPTFTANRVKLEENGIYNQVATINKQLVAITKQVAADKAYVAGDLAPLGKFLYPLGEMHFEEMVDVYREQVEALEEAGVDCYVVETMMNVAEARATVLAIREVSTKPIFVSFTCNEQGRTISGCDIVAVGEIFESMEIEAFGLNCSVGPKQMVEQILRLSAYAKVPLIAKPNAGMPKTKMGITYYDCDAATFTKDVQLLIDAGVKIFGGCCGTDASHIAKLKERLETCTFTNPPFVHHDGIVLASEHGLFTLDEHTSIDATYDINDELEEKLESLEGSLVCLKLKSEEELSIFERVQGSIPCALCIQCDDAQLLEKALRIYQGTCLYQGNVDENILAMFHKKYGLNY